MKKLLSIITLASILTSCEKMDFGWWKEVGCHCVKESTGEKKDILLENYPEVESCDGFEMLYGYKCTKDTPLPANS